MEEKVNSILAFADFIDTTDFDSLDSNVVEYTKRHLLDTFGCGIAGVTSDKGKFAIDFGRRCFGGSEATVLGYGDRLSVMGASFVNAELINGLDFEAAGLHMPPFVIPPALALAETEHKSGKDLITAVALALETGTRITQALEQQKPLLENGKPMGIPPICGPSSAVFGGAAGAAKMKGFGKEKTAHAMGLAGVMSPMLSQSSMHRDLPVNSGKYLMAGWAAQTGLTAAELVESGHRGNLLVLDSEFGYWRFSGHAAWHADKALADLGNTWKFMTITPYKKFPCCGMMHGGLECLTALVEEYHLRPDEIESIHAYLDPSSAEAMFHNPVIENQIDSQFSVAYNMSLVAYGIKPGLQWGDHSKINSPQIKEFMKKVSFSIHPECAPAQAIDPRNRVVSVEVKARGQVFTKELRFVKGTVTAGSAMVVTDEERNQKFRENTSLFLPEYKVNEAMEMLYDLENVKDVADLMKVLHV